MSETELSPESLPLVEMELKSEKSPLAVAEVNSKPSPVAKTELHSKSSHSADAEMNSIDKCDGNIHNRGQHVNLFPRGRCEATPLDRADRKRARFAEKNDECERPSTKLGSNVVASSFEIPYLYFIPCLLQLHPSLKR